MIFKWSMPFSFVAAVIRSSWAKIWGYEVLATQEDQQTREFECSVCCFYEEGQCQVCGCFTAAKTALNLERCPKGFWPRIWRKKRMARQVKK